MVEKPRKGIPRNPRAWRFTKPLVKYMRQNPTPAEELLWECLQNRKLGGYKFRRQQSADYSVTDFYCAEAMLIVEVDGSIHRGNEGSDALRTEYLENLGLMVIRFTNDDVLNHTASVLKRIQEVVENRLKSNP